MLSLILSAPKNLRTSSSSCCDHRLFCIERPLSFASWRSSYRWTASSQAPSGLAAHLKPGYSTWRVETTSVHRFGGSVDRRNVRARSSFSSLHSNFFSPSFFWSSCNLRRQAGPVRACHFSVAHFFWNFLMIFCFVSLLENWSSRSFRAFVSSGVHRSLVTLCGGATFFFVFAAILVRICCPRVSGVALMLLTALSLCSMFASVFTDIGTSPYDVILREWLERQKPNRAQNNG